MSIIKIINNLIPAILTLIIIFKGKLIKLFSEQIVIKSKMKNGCDQQLPSLTQWLQVVGLDKQSIECLCQKISSVEELQEKSEHELKNIVAEKSASQENLNKLFRALHNLKRYTGKFDFYVFFSRKLLNLNQYLF